jgi:precorrin-2 dehydrogenase/sirohydrochlorin ferrochelatase
MYPIGLDLSRARVGLVGRGFRALKRLALLDREPETDIRVFSDRPSAELAERAGARLAWRLPRLADLRPLNVLFVADLDRRATRLVLLKAQRLGLIVNVEDQPASSHFHSAAQIRRGDLTLAISTGGKSPALASLMRQHLEALIGPDWEALAAEAAEHRRRLKRAGADGATILAETARLLGLPPPARAPARPVNDNAGTEARRKP